MPLLRFDIMLLQQSPVMLKTESETRNKDVFPSRR